MDIATRCLQDLGSNLSVSLPWGDAEMVKHLPWELCGDIRVLQGVLGCPGEMLWCCSEMRECCGEIDAWLLQEDALWRFLGASTDTVLLKRGAWVLLGDTWVAWMVLH